MVDFCWLISTDAMLLAHDASPCKAGAGTKVGRISVGNNVFIGARSIILCNTRISDNVIIGAGAVVSHDIPSNSVVAGNLARIVCSFDEFQAKHQNNRANHTVFHERRWDEWSDAGETEWRRMQKELEETFGYL